jgi:cytochrome c oxidase assembly protein Cox11
VINRPVWPHPAGLRDPQGRLKPGESHCQCYCYCPRSHAVEAGWRVEFGTPWCIDNDFVVDETRIGHKGLHHCTFPSVSYSYRTRAQLYGEAMG